MSFATDILPTLTSIRAIPGQFGLRPYSVQVAIRWFSGTHTGDGYRSEQLTAVTEAGGQPPKVRFLNDEEIALGGLGKGTIEVGPITPLHSSGGTALETLTGHLDDGELLHYVVTGPEFPEGRNFKLLEVKTDSAMHYVVRLTPVDSNP